MLKSESIIALGLMGLSGYFMAHATVLPIGWVEGQGPGGGSFPFWLSLVMFLASAGILVRSLRTSGSDEPFFDPDMLGQVASVTLALFIAVALMPVLGTYVALPAFMVWYLKVVGRHGWRLTITLVIGTILVLFFFFEVTLRILLPKGMTEPLFIPLYQMFF
jgi:Na+/glutamate symporter